jgi:hypothetical protein
MALACRPLSPLHMLVTRACASPWPDPMLHMCRHAPRRCGFVHSCAGIYPVYARFPVSLCCCIRPSRLLLPCTPDLASAPRASCLPAHPILHPPLASPGHLHNRFCRHPSRLPPPAQPILPPPPAPPAFLRNRPCRRSFILAPIPSVSCLRAPPPLPVHGLQACWSPCHPLNTHNNVEPASAFATLLVPAAHVLPAPPLALTLPACARSAVLPSRLDNARLARAARAAACTHPASLRTQCRSAQPPC